ncbi:hypothetical protein BDC45DRAFT_562808 [Circinella umbellata]|nr:hypothetical protein BDC45DRAFT_562808 [Circinella umbellata]
MSDIVNTLSYLCFCPLCQRRNPGRGYIVGARTYRAHQNAAIIHEAMTGDPSAESNDYNDDGEYADVDGLLPEQFDPHEDEQRDVNSGEEIRPAIDIEFDGTVVDDNEVHSIISASFDLYFCIPVLFQINHISERIANTLISFISVLIGSFAGEEIRQYIPHSITGMKKWIGLDYLTRIFESLVRVQLAMLFIHYPVQKSVQIQGDV